MMRNLLTGAIAIAVCFIAVSRSVVAQDDTSLQLQQLTHRITQLEEKENTPVQVVHRETGGAALMLFGAFCALWVQNTNRNAWLWFFMGLLFNVITVIVLLVKNSNDRAERRSLG